LGQPGLTLTGKAVLVEDRPTNIQSSLAHEIGHGFRLGDEYGFIQDGEPNCGHYNCDVNPPAQVVADNGCSADCQVWGSGDDEGTYVEEGAFDIESREVFLPKTHYSFMGSRNDNLSWVTRPVYDHLFNQLQPAGALAKTAETREYLLLSGIICKDDTIELDPWHIVLADMTPSALEGGTYSIEFLDGSDNHLATYSFEPSFYILSNPPQETDCAPFSFVLPYPVDTLKVQIKHNEVVLEEVIVSANAPSVTVISPNGGESWTGTHDISWTASDLDGNSLSYSVFYSHDGIVWSSVATNITDTRLSWDTTEVPGGTNCYIKVVATDGINTAEDQSDAPFTVTKKSPSAVIISPLDGSQHVEGAMITLKGMGYDLEDGQLGGEALSWTSSISGNLGTGQLLHLTSLPEGTQAITLIATDSDGNVGTYTSTLTILTDTDGDGMPDSWESQYTGLDPNFDDAHEDLDRDSLVNVDERFFGTNPENPDTDHDGYSDGCEIAVHSDPLDSNSVPLKHVFGDFDCDCEVTVADIMQVACRWRTSCDNADPDNNPATPNYAALYDVDEDGDIDIVDIMLVVKHWGESCP